MTFTAEQQLSDFTLRQLSRAFAAQGAALSYPAQAKMVRDGVTVREAVLSTPAGRRRVRVAAQDHLFVHVFDMTTGTPDALGRAVTLGADLTLNVTSLPSAGSLQRQAARAAVQGPLALLLADLPGTHALDLPEELDLRVAGRLLSAALELSVPVRHLANLAALEYATPLAAQTARDAAQEAGEALMVRLSDIRDGYDLDDMDNLDGN